jgi:hypothetical protein
LNLLPCCLCNHRVYSIALSATSNSQTPGIETYKMNKKYFRRIGKTSSDPLEVGGSKTLTCWERPQYNPCRLNPLPLTLSLGDHGLGNFFRLFPSEEQFHDF